MPGSELAVIQPGGTLDDRLTYAREFAMSGLFPDVRTASQCLAKIQAGAEIGVPPFAAMSGIHIIEGKPSIGGGIFAALIDASPDHDLEVLQHDDEAAHGRLWVRSKRSREWIIKGEFRFSWADAIKAGLSAKPVWQKNRRQMLFWRMISNLARMYAAALCAGMYTPEELNAPIDEDGNYIPPEPAERTVRTVQLESIEDVPNQAIEPVHPQAGPLRELLLNELAETARLHKYKTVPATVAKALALEVPQVVKDLYHGKGKLDLDALTNVQLVQLAHHAGGHEPIPLPEAQTRLDAKAIGLSGGLEPEPEPEPGEEPPIQEQAHAE